jgi:hypothetical protein
MNDISLRMFQLEQDIRDIEDDLWKDDGSYGHSLIIISEKLLNVAEKLAALSDELDEGL